MSGGGSEGDSIKEGNICNTENWKCNDDYIPTGKHPNCVCCSFIETYIKKVHSDYECGSLSSEMIGILIGGSIFGLLLILSVIYLIFR